MKRYKLFVSQTKQNKWDKINYPAKYICATEKSQRNEEKNHRSYYSKISK